MKIWRLLLLQIALLVALPQLAAAGDGALPLIKSRINDHAMVISRSQRHLLYQMLAQHEHASHIRLVVVTAEDTGSEPLQAFAEQTWQAWGSKRKSRGVMLLLLKQPQRAAIIAGSELGEKVNAQAITNIIEKSIQAPLASADFDSAAMEGVKGILSALSD